MREFASETNLLRAAGLAALVTTLSLGRLVDTGRPLHLFAPALFLLLLFLCGAVTAWGKRADMAGIATDRATLLRGAAVAAAIALVALPVRMLWIDPVLRAALAATGDGRLLALHYPSTASGRTALLLWSAGFQSMFLVAAPMSLFARLTNRRGASLALCLACRAFLAAKQAGLASLAAEGTPFMLAAVASNAAACLVFAWYGLLPAMLLAAGLELHVLLR